MDIVILDLEWNGAYSRKLKGYINEIIEFGAVKCGPDLQEKDTFSCFVKPQVGKHISATISTLTNITDDHLAEGVPFMQAVSRFQKWAGDCLVLTWGTSDILTLVENCRYFSGREQVPFLHQYCDLQLYAQHVMGLGTKEQVGLSKAAELLKLDLSGMEHHRALDDSRMTLEILKKIYHREQMKPFLHVCDKEFYRWITFKTTYICDLDDPMVEPEFLQFACPKCGGEGRRKGGWGMKNKSFRGEFRCKQCGHIFGGRLTMKLKYEGLMVTKKTFPVPILEKPRAGVPGPLGNMELKVKDGVGFLQFPQFAGKGVNHCFSTRMGGVSKKEFAAMNLGFGRGDQEEAVAENYRILCKAVGFNPESLVAGAQDHHVNIRRVTEAQKGIGIWKEKDMESIDGLCTDRPGVTLCIYCADCVPLYFVDPVKQAIGLAHAGWKGTAADMAGEMVRRMAQEFGSRAEDLLVGIGPSICKDCFEVDPPVAEEFLKLPHSEVFVTGPEIKQDETKYHVDLWECNRQFLLAAGVTADHIFKGGVCSMDESDLIFSHRKTRGRRGSNCAFLCLEG